jgi:hypothetical protein
VGQSERSGFDELALGAAPCEKHQLLEREADDRVDAGPAPLGGGIPDQPAHEAQIERLLLDAHHRRPSLPRGGTAEEAPSSHPAGDFLNTLARFNCGACHVSSSASGFGQYSRIAILLCANGAPVSVYTFSILGSTQVLSK